MVTTLYSKRSLALALTGIALVTLAVWWGLWRISAYRYQRELDSWVAEGRAAGYEIGWDERRLFGFPRHVTLRLRNLRWRNAEGIGLQAGDIDIAASPWQSHVFDAKFKGGATLTVPLAAPRRLTLGGTDGHAHVKLDSDGVWKEATVVLDQGRLGREPDFTIGAGELKIDAIRPRAAPKDHHDTGLTVLSSAREVVLPPALAGGFGSLVKTLRLDLRVMGPMPDFRRRAAIAAWNEGSGVVEVDRFDLHWGPLPLAARGTIGFDDDLQPEGAFASVVGNQGEVLKILAASGFVAAQQAEMLQAALTRLGKPGNEDGVTGVNVPITVQLGGLFLGPVKIYSFPEIEWPEEPDTGAAPAEGPG